MTSPIAGGVDCDLHPAVPHLTSLLPYLNDYWRDQVTTRGMTDLVSQSYPANSPISSRPDWRPAKGKPGSSLEDMQAQALDRFGVRYGICNPLYGVQMVFSEDMADAFCRALNDWLVKGWLDRDTRLRGSIVIPVQSIEKSVAEIERCAKDKRFVQVLMLVMGDMPLGKRAYWPIYAAAERLGLPIGIHAGSNYHNPPTSVGWGSYHIEDYVAQAQAFQTQLTSLIVEGVFARHPNLKMVMLESGFTWLPSYLWRLHKFWRGIRMETPWVDRSPLEIVRSNIRFSLQPIDAPPDPATLNRLFEHMQSDKHQYQGMMEGPPYPKAQPNASRRDAYPPEGGPQGSSLSFMQQQHLDPNNVVLGVLNPLATGQGIRNHDLSAAICSAINDWQIEKWTSKDARLKGSVVVANEDGRAAAKEVRRRTGDGNFVQVLLLSRNVEPLGQRRYWPIYEAAEEAGLPIGVHAFGFGGNPITASGWPSFYIEEMVGHSQCQQTALASIVLEGVFERHPKLKMIMIEAGFGWAPSLAWRLDKCWQRLRSEVPHVKRPPSEYIRDQVYWTTQPMEDPERRDHLLEVIEWVGWDKLLFATDYPHWDYDDPSRVLPAGVSETNREAFYLNNALKLYGLA